MVIFVPSAIYIASAWMPYNLVALLLHIAESFGVGIIEIQNVKGPPQRVTALYIIWYLDYLRPSK